MTRRIKSTRGLGPAKILTSGPGKGMEARRITNLDDYISGLAADPGFIKMIADARAKGPMTKAELEREMREHPMFGPGGCVQGG